jgi:uncharacterized phage protein (TIGR02218 family)
MRATSPQLAAALDAEVSALALIARVARRDGVLLAWTSADAAIDLEGVRYEPAPGFAPSAIELDGDEAGDLSGVLSDDSVTEEDVEAGRFDDARVMLALVDATEPAAGAMILSDGRIARVEATQGAFKATVRNALAALEASPVALCAPECRAELGDRACRVNLAARRTVAKVAAAAGVELGYGGSAGAGGTLAYGRVRCLTGPAAGLERGVAAPAADATTLEAPLDGVAADDLVELTEGCDKRFVTCRDRFGNALNFQGEPHVPGGDAVTRYAGL